MKMHLKILSAKWQPFCPGEDELMALVKTQETSHGVVVIAAIIVVVFI